MLTIETSSCQQETGTCTYTRWVQERPQSGLYSAPISNALLLSSPLRGFWKPLNANTTPFCIREREREKERERMILIIRQSHLPESH